MDLKYIMTDRLRRVLLIIFLVYVLLIVKLHTWHQKSAAR
jgi:hypothetical protein